MNPIERNQIIRLLKQEVIPAIGCTEPVAVALCAAKAAELLGETPQQVSVRLSENVLKNAMGVGIPGTDGMIGLPIAVALGIVAGKSEYQLEVLKDCTPPDVERGKQLLQKECIEIRQKKDTTETLYIEVECKGETNRSTAIISREHTHFSYLAFNGTVLKDASSSEQKDEKTEGVELSLPKIYAFAMDTPLSEIDFILESAAVNRAAAEMSFKGNYGHGLGKIFKASSKDLSEFPDDLRCMLAFSCAACDARMAGAMIPVMSNSGSGNQGIAATLPVLIYAERNHKPEEALVRALILSHLTVIYVKQYLGRLSALCGCVVATTGASCGLVHLMGGNYEQVCFAVKNMIANLTGMFCDGAKPSCSMKLSSGVYSAMLSAQLAIKHVCVTSAEGIVQEDVDDCIKGMSLIGQEGMREANKIILDIMTHKDCLPSPEHYQQ